MVVSDVFGARILALRGSKSQAEVAKCIGTNPQTLGRYEQGKRKPDIEIVQRIADYYDVSVDFLLGREPKSNEKEMLVKIYELSGLTSESIEKLRILNERNRATWEMNVVNDILSSTDFVRLIYYITQALTKGDHEIEYDVFKTTKKTLGKTQSMMLFQNILEAISEKYDSIPDYRVMYSIAYGLYDDNKLTKEQLEKTLREFDLGNFDYSPLHNK